VLLPSVLASQGAQAWPSAPTTTSAWHRPLNGQGTLEADGRCELPFAEQKAILIRMPSCARAVQPSDGSGEPLASNPHGGRSPGKAHGGFS
jgi:hypothetical protein